MVSSLQDPSDANDRLVVTFALNEAGTAYCRFTRSDSGETDLRRRGHRDGRAGDGLEMTEVSRVTLWQLNIAVENHQC